MVAYGRGGATETVVPLGRSASPTGVWFDRPDAESLADAVERLDAAHGEFDPAALRAHAERFGAARFRDAIRTHVNAAMHASTEVSARPARDLVPA